MKYKYLLIILVALLSEACSKFLDAYPNGDRTRENVFDYQESVQGLIGRTYDYLGSDYSSKNYNSNETAYLDCATDNAVRRSTTDAIVQFAKGELTTGGQACYKRLLDKGLQCYLLDKPVFKR